MDPKRNSSSRDVVCQDSLVTSPLLPGCILVALLHNSVAALRSRGSAGKCCWILQGKSCANIKYNLKEAQGSVPATTFTPWPGLQGSHQPQHPRNKARQ